MDSKQLIINKKQNDFEVHIPVGVHNILEGICELVRFEVGGRLFIRMQDLEYGAYL